MKRDHQLEEVDESLEEAKYKRRKELFLQASLMSEQTLTGGKGYDSFGPTVIKEGLYGVDHCTKQESIFFLKVNKVLP